LTYVSVFAKFSYVGHTLAKSSRCDSALRSIDLKQKKIIWFLLVLHWAADVIKVIAVYSIGAIPDFITINIDIFC